MKNIIWSYHHCTIPLKIYTMLNFWQKFIKLIRVICNDSWISEASLISVKCVRTFDLLYTYIIHPTSSLSNVWPLIEALSLCQRLHCFKMRPAVLNAEWRNDTLHMKPMDLTKNKCSHNKYVISRGHLIRSCLQRTAAKNNSFFKYWRS